MTYDIVPDEGLPLTDLIDVQYHSERPSAIDTALVREQFIAKGYSAVTSEVHRQTVGYPYRVEYRGVK